MTLLLFGNIPYNSKIIFLKMHKRNAAWAWTTLLIWHCLYCIQMNFSFFNTVFALSNIGDRILPWLHHLEVGVSSVVVMTPMHGENLLKKQTNTKIFYCNLESKNLSMHWRHHLSNSCQLTSEGAKVRMLCRQNERNVA